MKEDPEFVRRAKDWGGGFIVGGENYGQGSSREHAALAPLAQGIGEQVERAAGHAHSGRVGQHVKLLVGRIDLSNRPSTRSFAHFGDATSQLDSLTVSRVGKGCRQVGPV